MRDPFGGFSVRRRARTVTAEERDRVVRLVEDERAVLAQPDLPCWWQRSGRVKIHVWPEPSGEDLARGSVGPEYLRVKRLQEESVRRAQVAYAADGPSVPSAPSRGMAYRNPFDARG